MTYYLSGAILEGVVIIGHVACAEGSACVCSACIHVHMNGTV